MRPVHLFALSSVFACVNGLSQSGPVKVVVHSNLKHNHKVNRAISAASLGSQLLQRLLGVPEGDLPSNLDTEPKPHQALMYENNAGAQILHPQDGEKCSRHSVNIFPHMLAGDSTLSAMPTDVVIKQREVKEFPSTSDEMNGMIPGSGNLGNKATGITELRRRSTNDLQYKSSALDSLKRGTSTEDYILVGGGKMHQGYFDHDDLVIGFKRLKDLINLRKLTQYILENQKKDAAISNPHPHQVKTKLRKCGKELKEMLKRDTSTQSAHSVVELYKLGEGHWSNSDDINQDDWLIPDIKETQAADLHDEDVRLLQPNIANRRIQLSKKSQVSRLDVISHGLNILKQLTLLTGEIKESLGKKHVVERRLSKLDSSRKVEPNAVNELEARTSRPQVWRNPYSEGAQSAGPIKGTIRVWEHHFRNEIPPVVGMRNLGVQGSQR